MKTPGRLAIKVDFDRSKDGLVTFLIRLFLGTDTIGIGGLVNLDSLGEDLIGPMVVVLLWLLLLVVEDDDKVVEAAVLVEAGSEEFFDRVIIFE